MLIEYHDTAGYQDCVFAGSFTYGLKKTSALHTTILHLLLLLRNLADAFMHLFFCAAYTTQCCRGARVIKYTSIYTLQTMQRCQSSYSACLWTRGGNRSIQRKPLNRLQSHSLSHRAPFPSHPQRDTHIPIHLICISEHSRVKGLAQGYNSAMMGFELTSMTFFKNNKIALGPGVYWCVRLKKGDTFFSSIFVPKLTSSSRLGFQLMIVVIWSPLT